MEKVNFQLESTLPELKDLETLKLFTRSELRQITLKRTKYERELIKRIGKPDDYLEYAKFEMGVERLRRVRVKRMKMERAQKKISSHSIPRRILYILRRATEKFPRDFRCWLALSDYARSEGMSKVVANTLTSALQLHPLQPIFYILLSSHYLDPAPPKTKRQTTASLTAHSSNFSIENIPSARKTLLLGLRFLPTNIDLWIEYVKLEIGWVEALRRRWKVLGILDSVTGADTGAELKDGVEGAEGLGDEDVVPVETDMGQGAFGSSGEAARRQIINGDLIITVLQNSFNRSELGSSLNFHLRLIELLRVYPTGLRSRLLGEVYANLRDRLGRDYTARRIVLEKDLFDQAYPVPETDESVAQPEDYEESRVKGEASKVAVDGGKLVTVLAGAIKAMKVEQDEEKTLGEDERQKWRRGWEDVIGAFLLRWAGRADENEDLRKFLLASLTSITQSPSTTSSPASANLLAAHLDFLLSLPSSSSSRPTTSKLQKLAERYTGMQPTSVLVWTARLDIEKLVVEETSDGSSAVALSGNIGRLYLSAMDKVGAAEGAGKLWVEGLAWLDGLQPETKSVSAAGWALPEHWRLGLRGAQKFVGDIQAGERGERLFAEVVLGCFDAQLRVLLSSRSSSVSGIRSLVRELAGESWDAPVSALAGIYAGLAEVDVVEADEVIDLARIVYRRWNDRGRESDSARVDACLAHAELLLTRTKGRAKEAYDLVEAVRSDISGSAIRFNGRAAMGKDLKLMEEQRKVELTRLEEGWRDILRGLERKREEGSEDDSSEEDEEDSDDMSIKQESESSDEDVDME